MAKTSRRACNLHGIAVAAVVNLRTSMSFMGGYGDRYMPGDPAQQRRAILATSPRGSLGGFGVNGSQRAGGGVGGRLLHPKIR